MSDIAWFSVCLAILFVAAGIVGVQDRIADQEAAKAGLQQCVVDGQIVWQRECK